MKKIISILIILSVLFSTVPVFNITASAASVTYYETSEDSVPLRNAKGSENTTVSKISKKGTVVKLIKSEKNWTTLVTWTNWHKVQVSSGTTNNGLSGDFWLWNGNVNKHKHSLSAGACTSTGCDYVETIETIDSKKMTMEVKEKTSAVRKAPYNDGEMVADLKKGDLVSVTNKVKNYKGSYWYKLSSGDYIFSGNVKEASAKTVEAASNSVNNSGGNGSGDGGSGNGSSSDNGSSSGNNSSSSGANSGYFTPPQTITLPCSHINWSVGKCVDCGKAWDLKEIAMNATYYANQDNVIVRDIPYKQGTKIKTLKKGDKVNVIARAENSAHHIWHKTSDGYWVYEVGQGKLNRAYFSTSGYTFTDSNKIVQPQIIVEPSYVEYSTSWKSDNTDVAKVDSNGKISAVSSGKTKIHCTITPKVGNKEELCFDVNVSELIDLEKWTYNDQKYEQKLALECVEYCALAYPEYDYVRKTKKSNIPLSNKNGNIFLNKTKDYSENEGPINLTDLLKYRNFGYQISTNYYNMTEENSPFVIASKKVNYNGVPKDVVYVIIEGSAGIAGWRGNMKMTGSSYSAMDTHYTFNASAITGEDSLKKGLETYIKENKLNKPIVVITGHSRGAAAGNILAENITGSSNYEKVYAYLFATPNVKINPNKSSDNIINICNELDFVSYIPFSGRGWDFEKYGKIYEFNSYDLYNHNSTFIDTVEYSLNYNKPDYVWDCMTINQLRSYATGKWKNVLEYYKHKPETYSGNNEAYDYFYNGLAPAAAFDFSNGFIGGASKLFSHKTCDKNKCPFRVLSDFFLANGLGTQNKKSFKSSHQIETYHAAIYANATLNKLEDNINLFSINTFGNDVVELNQDEYDALHSFFSQTENELMLEVAGWDIEDSSTWEGIKWNIDGNVVSIDLSYLNLGGWFNANNFPKLQDLNVDGNSLTMLAVSECSELVNLSCMANNLGSLAVNECGSLQNLDCGFNQISSLDISNMSQLSELNCYGNQINDLDLSGATVLQTLRCGNNELTSLDISTNTSLNTLLCGENKIIESQNEGLLNNINAINLNGGTAELGFQKQIDGYSFNTAELLSLTEFANMSLNLEKLGWDLDDPYTWQGVEWKIIGGEYHITSINFNGLDLEGDFNLPEAEYVESVSCENSSLTTLNLAGCTSLSSINCYNSGISSLEIENCSSLTDINCDENYLKIEDVESSLSQIGLSAGIATYETQNIAADEENFNQVERDVLIAFLSTGTNADVLGWDWNWPGTWDGIVWTNADGEYRVNKIDFSDKDVCGSLDLSTFEYLEDFDFSGSQIETIVLPDCITKIPEHAFYNSGIKYIHMSEGVTNIEKSAFSYCDDLNTIVLPSTVTRIMDNAFYESKNLKNLVFIGNEPAEVGTEIAYGTSPEFNIIFFNDSIWNGTTELLNDYSYITKDDDYIVLLDENIELKDDSYYNETNNYAGDDINVTIISKTPGASATCLLSVYDELGRFNELASAPIEMNRYMTVATFEDVNVQYVGEEFCTLKAFLWSNLNSLKPLTIATEKVLIKPLSE